MHTIAWKTKFNRPRPFLGIGHSALAAKECADLVEQFIGFDIDEAYLKVASEMLDCDYSSD